MKKENLLQALFAQHPKEKGFHLTSDGQAFTAQHKGDALNHAKTLSDKTVEWVENPKNAESQKPKAEDEKPKAKSKN